jgi:hypothetical protein
MSREVGGEGPRGVEAEEEAITVVGDPVAPVAVVAQGVVGLVDPPLLSWGVTNLDPADAAMPMIAAAKIKPPNRANTLRLLRRKTETMKLFCCSQIKGAYIKCG